MTDTERKARQRRAGVDENKASAERVDAALVRTIRDMGRRFSGKRSVGRAHSPFELPLVYVLDKVARSFPATERRKVFTRLGFDPVEFLEENGELKDWSWERTVADRQGR